MRKTAALVLAGALPLAACARDEGPAGGTTSSTGTSGPSAGTGATGTAPTGATSPTGPSATSPEPSLAPELGDGVHFGFVEGVDVAGGTIVFDLAYFLTGEEANQAAAEHGFETPVPNDYFIVNDNPKLRTLALSPDLQLALLNWNHCCDEFFEGDLTTFATAINTGEQVTVGDEVYLGPLSQYWLTVNDGVVIRVEEQYLP